MLDKILNRLRGWWNNMFDYSKIINGFGLDSQTSKEILDAIQLWADIYNGHEPWLNDGETKSLHVAKTICEKVAKAVTIEYKSTCDEPYINLVYQNFLRDKRKFTECMIGKSCVFFRPYFVNNNISISIIQADKFIPIKFSDDGKLTACIIIDQFTKEKTVYTRLEYNDLIDNTVNIKNIVYKGRTDGVVLAERISLQSVERWKDIEETSTVEGVDRLIGGFATMKTVNNIDNSSPLGVPIFHNAIDTLKEIDKQYTRTLWEYEGSELAIDVDATKFFKDKKTGNLKFPKGKQRLFRTVLRDTDDNAGVKGYNVFSPVIRDTSMFNGLNELLRQAESECSLAFGVISKEDNIAKTATEIKSAKQDYYITVCDIQEAMEQAFDDLIYGIYILCKLYGIPVQATYNIEHDWDDSILVDKDSARNQALLEKNNGITSDVQYIIETRNMKENEAIEFVKKQKEYRKLTEEDDDTEVDEE